MPNPFELTKWYLDCVTAEGDAFIGYWAELGWRGLAARYASTLAFVGGHLGEHASLLPGDPPELAGGRVHWRCAALKSSGEWLGAGAPAFERTLHRHGRGRLEWRCLQPLARANVVCSGRRFAGAGYAEVISLSIAPWDLPIDELRWGRALFEGRSVVWVDWTGDPPCRVVLVDGVEVAATDLSDRRIATARTHVTLSEPRTLREGPVAGTSVAMVPGVQQALSQAGLLIDEHKWLSAATLEEDGVALRGFAIHEVVKWR